MRGSQKPHIFLETEAGNVQKDEVWEMKRLQSLFWGEKHLAR